MTYFEDESLTAIRMTTHNATQLLKTDKYKYVRGESKFEISTLSANLTLRGWGDQVLDANDCNFGFSLFNDCQD